MAGSSARTRSGVRRPAERGGDHQQPRSLILDAACGSGLTGSALRTLGYTRIVGIDISDQSLQLAERTGAYEQVQQVETQDYPLPCDDGTFDAICFICALTCFETPEILSQPCRIAHSGGCIVFSHRDDLMREVHEGEHLAESERQGLWTRRFGNEPNARPLAPPAAGDRIRFQDFVYEVS